MTKKLKITVACGGASTEHAVSVVSANNIIAVLDPKKYEVGVLYIAEDGNWYWTEDTQAFIQEGPNTLLQKGGLQALSVHFGKGNDQPWQSLTFLKQRFAVDCVIPILHGTEGEDGVIQGLFELLDLPYVGSGVLSSAICMDKDMTKRLLRAANLVTTDWHLLDNVEMGLGRYEEFSRLWNTDVLFVKAVSLGSSVGIYRVTQSEPFDQAIREAFKYDSRVIIEPGVVGREIECSVLGNTQPKASLPGEIVVRKDRHLFYSYNAKYHDPDAVVTITPAQLSPEIIQHVQTTAITAFKILRCEGMARVDFFLVDDKKLLLSEVNTIPGFTAISLYPKMWETSGLGYAELIDELIALALERHQRQRSLIRIYESAECTNE